MDYKQLKALVKEMRSAQKEYFKLRGQGYPAQEVKDALQRSKALEKRVDDAIAEPINNNGDVILMANEQKLVQGSLF